MLSVIVVTVVLAAVELGFLESLDNPEDFFVMPEALPIASFTGGTEAGVAVEESGPVAPAADQPVALPTSSAAPSPTAQAPAATAAASEAAPKVAGAKAVAVPGAQAAAVAAIPTATEPFQRPSWMDPGGEMKVYNWGGSPHIICGTLQVQFKRWLGGGGNSEVWRVSEPISSSASSRSGVQPAECCTSSSGPFSPSPDDYALKVLGVKGFMGNTALVVKENAFKEYRAARAVMRCPYIVRTHYVGHINGSDGYQYPCLLMALAPHGSLLDRVCPGGVPKGMSPAECARYVAMVLLGLQQLHDKGVIHRDIKPHNVLLTGDVENPHAQLTDFGSAARVSISMGAYDKRVGTPGYEAPEMEAGLGQDGTTDVFLLAEMLLHLRWGRMPFWYLLAVEGDTAEVLEVKKDRRRDLVAELQHPECPYTNSEPAPDGVEKLTSQELGFLSKGLQFQANARPKVTELLQDPLMQSALQLMGIST